MEAIRHSNLGMNLLLLSSMNNSIWSHSWSKGWTSCMVIILWRKVLVDVFLFWSLSVLLCKKKHLELLELTESMGKYEFGNCAIYFRNQTREFYRVWFWTCMNDKITRKVNKLVPTNTVITPGFDPVYIAVKKMLKSCNALSAGLYLGDPKKSWNTIRSLFKIKGPF